MNKFYLYISFLFVACATLAASCSDDEVYPSMTLSQQSVYFAKLDQSITITYTGSNIDSVEVEDVPDGWTISVKKSSKKIVVTGPTTQDDFDNSLEASTVTFIATSEDDNSTYKYLTVGTTSLTEDISAQQANCFIVSNANTMYYFSALTKGEDQEAIAPASVAILWQSYPKPLSYSRLIDNQVEFHLAYDEDDVDSDLQFDDIVEGNAVIAAYDKNDNIIWSWHIWVTDFDPETTSIELNGATLMGCNIGASNNSISDHTAILDSYGLYYQWGRKDPFISAYYYNAAQSLDDTMYDETGTSVSITYEESTSSVGKESYALANPLTYILGVEDSGYDWLYSAHSDELWGEQKTLNDPCPKGWRVPSPETFQNLYIPTYTTEELAAIADDYGWYMNDAQGNGDLFMALGRRGYITGKIQNVNLNIERPEPWAGYYWTTESLSGNISSAFFFAFDQYEPSGNQTSVANHYRAGGMQVRCQKVD